MEGFSYKRHGLTAQIEDLATSALTTVRNVVKTPNLCKTSLTTSKQSTYKYPQKYI